MDAFPSTTTQRISFPPDALKHKSAFLLHACICISKVLQVQIWQKHLWSHTSRFFSALGSVLGTVSVAHIRVFISLTLTPVMIL